MAWNVDIRWFITKTKENFCSSLKENSVRRIGIDPKLQVTWIICRLSKRSLINRMTSCTDVHCYVGNFSPQCCLENRPFRLSQWKERATLWALHSNIKRMMRLVVEMPECRKYISVLCFFFLYADSLRFIVYCAYISLGYSSKRIYERIKLNEDRKKVFHPLF